MGNSKHTPIKFSVDTIETIANDLLEWYVTNSSEIAYQKFLLTKKYLTKQNKMEYCNICTFFENYRDRYKFVYDIIQQVKQIQELRLLDGLTAPFKFTKSSNGCRFLLQTKHGYIPKEEHINKNTDIKLNFEELKEEDTNQE
jgi:hypothetical protein